MSFLFVFIELTINKHKRGLFYLINKFNVVMVIYRFILILQSNISFMKSKVFLVIFAFIILLSASTISLISQQKKFAWYTFDEGPTRNRCDNSQKCDGERNCSSFGWCQGISRPAKNAFYIYDEAPTRNQCPTNSGNSNYPNRDYYCDGNRTCSSTGWCQGTSRPVKNAIYQYDEAPTGNRCPSNTSYSNYTIRDYYCDGQRTCSSSGWCSGTSRPAKSVFYSYDEAPTGNKCPSNSSDSKYAVRNYYCDGQRTCSSAGWCQGTSRPAKSVFYQYDEALTGNKCPLNASDSNYVIRNYYCDGQRTCSSAGWCQETSRPAKSVFYSYDEAPTGNKCPSNSSDSKYAVRNYYCDGQRTCSSAGWCQGTSRPAKSVFYQYDEALTGNKCPLNASDSNYVIRNYYCDGQRTCSSAGWCQGTSRPAKGANYYYDEALTGNKCPLNTSDASYPIRDYFCDGKRTCSFAGWCQGTSR